MQGDARRNPMPDLTEAQRRLLTDARRIGGRLLHDKREYNVASRLKDKGYVTFHTDCRSPAVNPDYGFYGAIKATDEGRNALEAQSDG